MPDAQRSRRSPAWGARGPRSGSDRARPASPAPAAASPPGGGFLGGRWLRERAVEPEPSRARATAAATSLRAARARGRCGRAALPAARVSVGAPRSPTARALTCTAPAAHPCRPLLPLAVVCLGFGGAEWGTGVCASRGGSQVRGPEHPPPPASLCGVCRSPVGACGPSFPSSSMLMKKSFPRGGLFPFKLMSFFPSSLWVSQSRSSTPLVRSPQRTEDEGPSCRPLSPP